MWGLRNDASMPDLEDKAKEKTRKQTTFYRLQLGREKETWTATTIMTTH